MVRSALCSALGWFCILDLVFFLFLYKTKVPKCTYQRDTEIVALKRLFKAETASVPFKLKYYSTAILQLKRRKTVFFFKQEKKSNFPSRVELVGKLWNLISWMNFMLLSNTVQFLYSCAFPRAATKGQNQYFYLALIC